MAEELSEPKMRTTPYRVETERLVIRCWDPRDAPKAKEAIDASLEHLRAWMPWAANEPTSVEEKAALLRGFRGRLDLDQDFTVGVFSPDEAKVMAGCGLHDRGDERSLEMGYWVRSDAVGQGLATELAGALTRVAFELFHIPRVEIWTAVANVRSARVAEKLGYRKEGVLRRRRHVSPGVFGDYDLWTMLDDEYEGSPARSTRVRAFGVLGEELPFAG